ncbi:flavin reductase family protein [Ornithinimicrobium flavum]|uniref:flavin reductase family protein n=1 Tax=Ornithinimicrobium flavum TaxID=1288636 RepID=UPI00107039FA|nr:flavin reductase family protein [Ornithinimicrobium flavum]
MSVTALHPPPADLRSLFRRPTASTWVITSAAADDADPVGFTAISVVSVSLDPPLVSFNVAKTSSSLVTLARSRRAALHLLASHQDVVAARFAADRTRRFVEDGTWGWQDGLPRLHDVNARLVTTLTDLVDAGDSFVAIARVHTTSVASPAQHTLLHHAGRFAAPHQIGA